MQEIITNILQYMKSTSHSIILVSVYQRNTILVILEWVFCGGKIFVILSWMY